MPRRSSPQPEGSAHLLRCPYHGWTYALSGELKGTPDFAGVCDFDRAANGLVPLPVGVWESWVFVGVDAGASLDAFLGADLAARIAPLRLSTLQWVERRRYVLDCNWKVFVDNYLDGGYHVPHLHKGLDSVLDYGVVHDRERRALLPAVEPAGVGRRRGRDRRGPHGAIGRGTSGFTRTS